MLTPLSVRTGDVIGNYRVVRLLGAGGMGAVFEVVHQEINRRAAMKFLSIDVHKHPAIATRFKNEARAANEIDHPGVVQIFEFGQLADGTLWLLMELLPGETLYARLEAVQQSSTRRMGVEAALNIAQQLASVLVAAHMKGIVHRDLKPGNVMLVPDPAMATGERLKLLDFGIAKLTIDRIQGQPAGHIAQHKTVTGSTLGTPAYMAPEQCRSAAHVDAKADVYSLGVLIYQMLVGRLPFEAEEPLALMAKKNIAPAPPITGLDPNLPAEVAALTMSMLEFDSAARPTMMQIDAALCRLLGIDASRRSGLHAQVAQSPLPSEGPSRLASEDAATVDGPIDAPLPSDMASEEAANRVAALPPAPMNNAVPGPDNAKVPGPEHATHAESKKPALARTESLPPGWISASFRERRVRHMALVAVGLLGALLPVGAKMYFWLSPSVQGAPDLALVAAQDASTGPNKDGAMPSSELSTTPDLAWPIDQSTSPDLAGKPVQQAAAVRTSPAHPACPSPTQRCVRALSLPAAHVEYVMEALRHAELHLCPGQSLRIDYRQNAARQRLLDVVSPLPPGISAAKIARLLQVLDGKLPPGQKLSTPIVIKCPDQ